MAGTSARSPTTVTEVNATNRQLHYGRGNSFQCDLEADRVVAVLEAPRAAPRLEAEVATALEHPVEFPPLSRAVVPGDRVAIALDVDTPGDAEIVAALWGVLSNAGIEAEDLMVVQPVSPLNGHAPDPRRGLPTDVREAAPWIRHDPEDRDRHSYLANAASGERVYLAREIVEADVVLSVGTVGYDSLIGYRGTNSVLYPALSNTEAAARARGRGHEELDPDDQRPLRQLADEIGWLLGSMFTVQVVPAAGDGASHVVAGACEPTFGLAKHYLNQHWRIELDERPDAVVAAVDADAGGHGWRQVAAAAAAARNLVASGGKIVLLSEIDEPFGEGLNLVARCESPGDALRPLRELAPDDFVAATQLARAASWADVYLLSRHDPAAVEDLGIVPLEGPEEVDRVLAAVDSCVLLQSAQHVCGRIRG